MNKRWTDLQKEYRRANSQYANVRNRHSSGKASNEELTASFAKVNRIALEMSEYAKTNRSN